AQLAEFRDIVSDFIDDVKDTINTPVGTDEWEGDVLVEGGPDETGGTPSATPGPDSGGYLAVRVHTSKPGTDPREFVPLATADFLPLVSGLEGFRGYFWYPTDGGFVAISIFDSEEAAEESNAAARDWAAEHLTEYTD